MGRRESLVGFETGKLDSGVKHSQEDKASDDTAADALETNDSSDNYGPRPPKSEDAARLRKIYEQAHEGRKRQRKANFQTLLTSFGLVAYVAVSGFLFLRYATPRSKRPQQVGGGSDYGLHDGYQVRHDNWYIRDNPNPPGIATIATASEFRRVAPFRPKVHRQTMPADIDAALDFVYGPLPGNVPPHRRTRW
uniref:Transmembrane protein n=1 Tax=Toxoplasma gondii (strain ATCC 50861 / VEG) TaxID=432359 RepID=A0A0F7V3L9_TOXGV|nr:TPA: hypothetical protein BN1205_059990 [Toxoplasma gondii VEG]